MTAEQKLNAANEINGLWVRHIRNRELPTDATTVARIIERYEAREAATAVSRKPLQRLFVIR
jgi:hypothetical protein